MQDHFHHPCLGCEKFGQCARFRKRKAGCLRQIAERGQLRAFPWRQIAARECLQRRSTGNRMEHGHDAGNVATFVKRRAAHACCTRQPSFRRTDAQIDGNDRHASRQAAAERRIEFAVIVGMKQCTRSHRVKVNRGGVSLFRCCGGAQYTDQIVFDLPYDGRGFKRVADEFKHGSSYFPARVVTQVSFSS
ncbi:hypothetical protein ABC383_01090 [Noviherbaspirillum sp. 1P10PC]|uniref:hypothetical protein n=1 Tax=Noviherbaspirillum sp. 1P10PC TaxID=3132292 RepID=UPI0039A1FE06